MGSRTLVRGRPVQTEHTRMWNSLLIGQMLTALKIHKVRRDILSVCRLQIFKHVKFIRLLSWCRTSTTVPRGPESVGNHTRFWECEVTTHIAAWRISMMQGPANTCNIMEKVRTWFYLGLEIVFLHCNHTRVTLRALHLHPKSSPENCIFITWVRRTVHLHLLVLWQYPNPQWAFQKHITADKSANWKTFSSLDE